MSILSDIGSGVSRAWQTTTSAVQHTYNQTVRGVSDLGSAAINRASALGREGADLGRRGINAVEHKVDDAAAAISQGAHAVADTARAGYHQAQQINHDYQVTDRALGGLRAVGGGLEVAGGVSLIVAGAATSEFGIGLAGIAGGGLAVAHGLDQFQAGVHQTIDAKPHDDLTSQGLQAAGVPQNVANNIDTGASIVLGLGSGAAAKGLTAASERALVAAERAGPGGPLNRATFETYKDVLRADMAKPATTDPRLTSMMDKLYRPNAQVGSGSTASAVRQELATGQPVGGAFHSQKAADAITNLEKWLANNPTAVAGDRAAAENVIRDMQNALAGH